MENQKEPVLTVWDVMDILAIGKNRAYELLDSGELRGFRIGRTWRIPKRSIDEYINKKIG